ncbi:hypothetical protein D3C76_1450840 [compost metagenome]
MTTFLRTVHGTSCHKIRVSHYFSTDKSAFEICMNHTGSSRCFGAAANRPRPNFLNACCEIRIQAKQFISRFNQPVKAGFFQSQLFQEHSFIFAFKLSNFCFHLSTDRNHFCTFSSCEITNLLYIRIVLSTCHFIFTYIRRIQHWLQC